MNDLVRVENLAIDFATRFGTVSALKGVSFSLARGEALGIVGESGSGKTVACRALLKLIAANAKVTSGRILFEGDDVLAMGAARLERFRGEQAAMIFQNPSTHLDPIMPVWRQVGEAMVVHRGLAWAQAKARAIELLEDMQIADPARRAGAYPHELSGGMRQRVALARALAQDRPVLLMDEPFAALDAITRDLLHEELERVWRATGRTIVFVTHNVREAARLGQRVVLMGSRPGRIVQEWTIAKTTGRRIESPEVAALSVEITDQLRKEIRRNAA